MYIYCHSLPNKYELSTDYFNNGLLGAFRMRGPHDYYALPCTTERTDAYCRTATHALPHCHTLSSTQTASHCRAHCAHTTTVRTTSHTLPPTAIHCHAHCRTQPRARTDAYCRTTAPPHTAARTAIHYYQAHNHTLQCALRAHYRVDCHTLPLTLLPYTAALPDSRTLPHVLP
jgi:hypothetical protein